ncbi:hypothetical protein OPQ81_007349 [Rhizoctonia solani]|nr:hypothetical protein OPQ81_007349 [Rhizoctonia solani]
MAGLKRHLQFHAKCSRLQAIADGKDPEPTHPSDSSLSMGSDLDLDSDASNFWDGPEPVRSSERLVPSSMRADSIDMESVHYKQERNKPNSPTTMDPMAEDSNAPDPEVILEKILDTEGHEVFMESFPCPHAGQPIRWVDQTGRPWHKYPNIGALADPKAFEIAELLMQPGITARFQNSFLHLKRLCGKLPWQNNHALWKDIDKLPHGPDWEVQPFKLRGNSREEVVELWK